MDCVDESYEHWHVLHIKENVGGKHRKLLGRKKSLLDIIFVVHLHHTPNDSSSFKLKLSEKSEMNRETEARKPFCFFSASYLMVNTCQARNVYCKARESSLSLRHLLFLLFYRCIWTFLKKVGWLKRTF